MGAGMIEVGIALRSLETRSGDRATVVRIPGQILICAIDGLGHGAAAADAADAAVTVLEAEAGGRTLGDLLERCHEALGVTRGAVMTLALIDETERTLEWVGVGNVEARLLRSGTIPAAGGTEAPVLFGGVVGHHLPSVRTSTVPLAPGDLIVMATDGVKSDFPSELGTAGAAQAIADGVMNRSGKEDDDALVLVARWLGA